MTAKPRPSLNGPVADPCFVSFRPAASACSQSPSFHKWNNWKLRPREGNNSIETPHLVWSRTKARTLAWWLQVSATFSAICEDPLSLPVLRDPPHSHLASCHTSLQSPALSPSPAADTNRPRDCVTFLQPISTAPTRISTGSWRRSLPFPTPGAGA